jgi:hypothetical protein
LGGTACAFQGTATILGSRAEHGGGPAIAPGIGHGLQPNQLAGTTSPTGFQNNWTLYQVQFGPEIVHLQQLLELIELMPRPQNKIRRIVA